MPKAYVFAHAAEFTQFVKLNGQSRSAGSSRSLLVVRGPQVPGGTAFILTGFAPGGLSGLMSTFARKEVALSGDQARWKQEKHSIEGQIIFQRQAFSLVDFLTLEPAANPSADEFLYFHLKDGEAMARLVRQSFELRNDRLQFATVADGMLIRIDRPSFFLLQTYHEEGHAEIYRMAKPGIFVAWGWRHPLEVYWNRDDDEISWWDFLSPGVTEPVRRAAVPWQDIYDLISPETDLPLGIVATGAASAPERIRLPLRMVPCAKSREAELWLLAEDGLTRLEPLLAVLDQEDMVPYQVIVRKNPVGQEMIFIREKVARGTRRHLDFSGQGFAPFLGLNNLMLPQGWTLLPPLRRHVYRDLFRLQAEQLTLVVPLADGSLSTMELPERGFQSLTSLIDYIVEGDAVILQEHLEHSIFDLGPWTAAPSHSGLARPASSEPLKQQSSQLAPVSPAPEHLALEDELPEQDPNAFLPSAHKLDESTLDAWHRQELDLERAVIQRQTVSGWQELMRVKTLLQKDDDAMQCAVEALWLLERSPAGMVDDTLESLAQAGFPTPDDAMGAAPHPLHSCLAAFRMLGIAPEPDAPAREVEPWTRAMHLFLANHHDQLRLKERWLAWGWVLRRNGDLRREVQLRDEICTAICGRGLPLDNTPAFIRTRLFLDRSTSSGPDGPTGNAAERAASNLMALEHTVLTTCELASFAELWRSLLARVMVRLGDIPAASRMIAGLERSPDPWTALFASHCAMLIDPAQGTSAGSHLDRLLSQSDKVTTTLVNEAREVWSLRTKMDNPAAFLAQENRDRTYPKGGAAETGGMMDWKRQLEEAKLAGNEHAATSILQQMMSAAEAKDYNDPVKLPQLIESLVAGLERYKWGLRGAGLLPVFTAFAERVPGFVKKPDVFYSIVLRANLASGLLSADDTAGACRQIESAVQLLKGSMSELDLIDGCAAVVRTIEQLPLELRLPFLQAIVQSLFVRFDAASSGSHFFTKPRLYAALVRCCDQISEASISRDRLSLELFRNYQLQDEFLILQRIQNESFSQP